MDDSNTSALEFLQNLESRHAGVLDELDALNDRIEQVLNEYAKSREPHRGHQASSTQPGGETPEAA